MKNDKEQFDILDLLFPVLSVYVTWLCFNSYYIENTPEGTLFDVILLTIISFIFFYGVMAIVRDLKLFGVRWMLTSWRKIFKDEK
jgi:uncharacterized membrane protein YesL